MSQENFKTREFHAEPEKPHGKAVGVENELAEAIKKMYGQLREAGKNLREIIPQKRNFDIELQERESRINLRLKHKEGEKERDLGIFLPTEHYFGKDKEFVYNGREKKICFPENEIEFRGFLLSLFHEIGHSHESRGHSTTTWDSIKALWEGVSKLARSIRIKKEERESEGAVYKVTSLPAEALLPQWYLDKISHSEAKSERNAWAYALRSLRKLKQDGYDVFAGFENTAQIRAYVAYCLYTYDTEFFMKNLMSGNLKEIQKLRERPAFWKKSKLYK